MPQLNVYTVPFGKPFALALAQFVLKNHTALEIAKLRIIVPRPRQKETLEKAFLEASGGQTVWPTITSFGIEDDLPSNTLTLTQRTMLLCQLVQAWNTAKATPMPPARVLENAQTLAQLFDKLTNNNIPFEKLTQAQQANLLPAELAHHWQENLDFLSIVLQAYPNWLKENNKQDPTMARAAMVAKAAPAQKTIIAGFADTTPLGLHMMATTLQEAQNMLVLPGWPQKAPFKYADLPPAHPCYGMAKILTHLGVEGKEEILPLPGLENTPEEWLTFWDNAQTPPPHLPKVVEAPTPQTEAEAVALMMQETLQTKGKTCALVTPDRALAKRTAAVLAAKGVQVDDSAGTPLPNTLLGQLFLDILTCTTGQFKVLNLLPLVRNPLVNCGHARAEWLKAIQTLEESLRGKNNLGGLAALHDVVGENIIPQALENALTPLLELPQTSSLETLIAAHLNVLQNMLGEESLPPNVEAKKLMALLEKWQEAAAQTPPLTLPIYKGYLTALMAAETVRQPWQQGQLFIWGPLEASLQQVDHLILGGMNEGTWPHLPAPDPWLNRPLAASLGLPPAEVPVGLAAHDFLSLVSCANTTLTRTTQTAEGETVPSRFLTKLSMAAPKNMAHQTWVNWVTDLRSKGSVPAATPPAPLPANRPVQWSASHVKILMACPFQAYAKYVLQLKKPEPFEKEADARERGELIHACFESFCTPSTGWQKEWKVGYEEEMTAKLLEIGKEKFAELADDHKATLWWPRFENLAAGFVVACVEAFQQGRTPAQNEAKAKLETHEVTLSARADRVDLHNNGHIVIDYKTGAAPTKKEMATGKQPQMPIEALLAQKGAFGPPSKAEGIEIWRALGAGVESIEKTIVSPKELENYIENAEEGLANLATRFIAQKQPYTPNPADPTGIKQEKHCSYCDYAALCRFKDWGQARD